MKQHRKSTLWTCFMLMFFGLVNLAVAKPEKLNGLSIRLISDHATVTAGEPFLIGFHIQHEKGYHSYWKNPGLVGMATGLKWKLPAGYKISELSWPYPELSSMAGHPCYGYERDVTLYATITPPETITEKSVKIAVDAAWMCCFKDCFPGSKTFDLELPVADQTKKNAKATSLFELAKKETPDWDPITKTTCKVLSSPTDSVIKIQIPILPLVEMKDVYLFSEDGQVSSAKKQLVGENLHTWVITMERCEFSPKEVTHLPAVLKMGDQYFTINPAYEK